ncbi:MAG TPA: TRAP transporter small permease subunit [Chromatiaceae bacterium]|nr:TRAP transporter small permease subunit [Chromatiaceae bacterium]
MIAPLITRRPRETAMQGLLRLARLIDALNTAVGRTAMWLILAATLISAGNALMRYSLDLSSNAWLELQWYLFAAVFLLCAPYTLLKNEMVRIDVVAGRLSRRTQVWVDVAGTLFFLLPMALLLMTLSWPGFVQSFVRDEVSANAGGLVVWPARLLIPVGFALLALQGLSELIKRLAFLVGVGPDPGAHTPEKTPEQELATEIARRRGDLP